MTWTEDEEILNQFLMHCNNQNKNIQFEQTISENSILFLDAFLILEDGKLATDLYSKPTDKHRWIHQNKPTLLSCPTPSPYLFNQNLFQTGTHEIKHRFLQRGYTKGCIQDAINKTSSITREEALTNKNAKKCFKESYS